MEKIIALCNQKGGVGKTTTAINLGASIASLKKRVLLIDLDPQGNATSGMGIDKKTITASTYQLLIDTECDLNKVIKKTDVDHLYIIPSDLNLTGAEVELVSVLGREYRLKKALERAKDQFDYVFIDSPPSLGLLTINALAAARSVIIPLQCEYYALEGLGQLTKTINLVKESINPSLKIEGVLLTMADYRTNLTNEVIKEAREFFKEKVYKSVIPRNIKLSEAPGFGKPVTIYDPESIGARKYDELAKEIVPVCCTELMVVPEDKEKSEQNQENLVENNV